MPQGKRDWTARTKLPPFANRASMVMPRIGWGEGYLEGKTVHNPYPSEWEMGEFLSSVLPSVYLILTSLNPGSVLESGKYRTTWHT